MGLQLLEHGGFAQYLTGLLRASVEKNGNFLIRSLIGTDQGCTGTSEIKKHPVVSRMSRFPLLTQVVLRATLKS